MGVTPPDLKSLRASVRASLSRTAPHSNAEELVAHLIEDMGRRWTAGEHPVVEEYLAHHPELRDQPEAAVQLVCEEICLREEHGLPVDPQEVRAPFPQWP